MHNHGGEIYGRHYKLDYSVNVNCMGTPDSVVEAAARGAALSAQYPDVSCRELRSALAAFLSVKEDQIVFGNGAADVIFSAILAIKPKTVLVPAPTFAEYEHHIRTGGKGCRCPDDLLSVKGGTGISGG